MRRLLRLSRSEWLLLLQAGFLVCGIRVALWMWPYDRVRGWATSWRGVSKHRHSRERLVQVIAGVSRLSRTTNCLTRALAAEALLLRYGYDACLRIGVTKKNPDLLTAHAWIESGGVVVIGGDEIEGLTPLIAEVAQPSS